MIVKTHKMVSRNNPAPASKRDRAWAKEHARKLEMATENACCPNCGAALEERDELYDHGYRYGITCTYCS
jgi:hypothetical protein